MDKDKIIICQEPPTARYVHPWMTDAQWARFQSEAASRGMDVHELTEEILVKHLEQEGNE